MIAVFMVGGFVVYPAGMEDKGDERGDGQERESHPVSKEDVIDQSEEDGYFREGQPGDQGFDLGFEDTGGRPFGVAAS